MATTIITARNIKEFCNMKNENLDLTCISEMDVNELADFIEDLRDCNRAEELANTCDISVCQDN